MFKNTSSQFVKDLTDCIKNISKEDMGIYTNAAKLNFVDSKYINKGEYKQVVGLYKYIKNQELPADEYKYFKILEIKIVNNQSNFKYLKRCCDYIFDFASTLNFYGPAYIAQEMARQEKEIEYINNNILNK